MEEFSWIPSRTEQRAILVYKTESSRTLYRDQPGAIEHDYPSSELGTAICIRFDCRTCICHVDRQRWSTVYICVNVRHKPLYSSTSMLKSISSQTYTGYIYFHVNAWWISTSVRSASFPRDTFEHDNRYLLWYILDVSYQKTKRI